MISKKVSLLALAAILLSQTLQAIDARPGMQETRAQSVTAADIKWARYTYPGEELSVELPGTPAVFHSIRGINNSIYETEKVRVFGLYAEGIVFMVVSYDKPRGSESLDFFAKYGAGNPTPAGDVKLGEYAGRKYDTLAKGSSDLLGASRVFRTKKHAYLVKALFLGESQPSVERFLNSITLSAQASGERIAEDEPAPTYQSPPPAGTVHGAAGDAPTLARPMPDTRPVEGPFKNTEVTRQALIVYKPEPGFTEEARQNNVTGVVRLRAVLSSDGKVKSISVIKGLPGGLTEAAIRAARHMLFFPARKDGREVSQYIVVEYNFNIY